MILICKETINAWSDGTGRLFTNGIPYDFIPVDNRYTKQNNFIGYIRKDDEGYKRWLTKEFKEKYFVECK